MESTAKIKELKEKINELQITCGRFYKFTSCKKNKIRNLESEIEDIKLNMNKYLDDLEELIDKK